jgi:ABC-type branched-subunit amino acid transport system substrate-binding protein
MTARLWPGSVFAGYRIEAVIGRGGMGVVYRATDLSLDRPVALKLIAPELADDRRFRERFLDEPRLAASLDHASVVPIYEAGEHEGQLYLAMRYVQGSDLRTLLRRDGALEPERALAIVGQIAGALDAAHRQGLVHRDVKPANVLLDEDEHAYLTDFGVTQQLGDETAEAGTGTLDYLAPEQIRGEPVDGRTDGYALACVLYECLSGAPPFRRATAAETMWAHLREEPPPLESRPALDPVFRTGLAQERDDRYPSCAALIDAARAVLVPAPRPRRALLAAGAVVVVGAVAAAVFASTPGGEEGAAAKAPAGNGIVAVGPDSEQFEAFVETAAAPSNIAVGEGAVWFLNAADDSIARMDPETKAVTGRVPSPGASTDLAAGAGALWLGTGSGEGGSWTDAVHRIDPRTGDVTYTAFLPSEATGGDRRYLNAGFTQIAVGAGAVWATGGGWVARLEPRTGRLAAPIEANAYRIAAGREGVWFISPDDAGAVTQIDPATNLALPPIDVGDANLAGIAVGGGSVWVTAEREGFVWRITPGATPDTTPIDVGSGVNYVAYGAGALWVANYIDGTLSRIDPGTNMVVARAAIGTAQALAAGAGSAWAATVGATRAGTLPVSACEDVPGGARPDVLIASDLPLQDASDDSPPAMVAAIRAVLADHGFRAGKYTVGYRSCDDSTRQAAAFDRRRCAANANAYANADRLVAVIGPHNSGCSQVAVPILNRAPGGPVAMISPTNGDPGLTREGVPPPEGYRGSPEVFYPIGTRHYVRLAPPESLNGAAHAVLSKQLGLKKVYLIDDGSAYWKTGLTDPFRQVARKLRVRIAGSATFDPEATRADAAALAEQVERSGAQGVQIGAHPYGNVTDLLKALRARLGARYPIMVSYDLATGISTAELFEAVGPGMRGVYAATAEVPRTALPMTAAARRVAREVDADRPGVLEAAQAAELVLDAIAGSDGTRASVLERLRDSDVRDGILGTFRFDGNGDMTPGWEPIVRFTAPDEGRAIALEGAVVDRVVRVPPRIMD